MTTSQSVVLALISHDGACGDISYRLSRNENNLVNPLIIWEGGRNQNLKLRLGLYFYVTGENQAQPSYNQQNIPI